MPKLHVLSVRMWGSPGVNHSSGGWSTEARGIVKPGRWLCSQEKGYFPWDPSYLQRACMLSDAFTVIVPCCPHPSRWVVASITLSAWKRRRLRERVLHSGSRWASQPSLQAGPRWSVLLRNPTHPTGQLQETDAAMGEAIVMTQGSKATEWSLEAPPISKSSQPQQKSLLCGPGFV